MIWSQCEGDPGHLTLIFHLSFALHWLPRSCGSIGHATGAFVGGLQSKIAWPEALVANLLIFFSYHRPFEDLHKHDFFTHK